MCRTGAIRSIRLIRSIRSPKFTKLGVSRSRPAWIWSLRAVAAGTPWGMPRDGLHEEALTRSIIGAFFEVYNALGFGFLESLYAAALERELIAHGHEVAREFAVEVFYKGESIGWQRLDLVVDGRLVVEIKSTRLLPTAATRQLYNYLHATRMEVGLLLHFGPEPQFFRVVRLRRDGGA